MALPRVFVVGDSISLQYGPWLERYLAGTWHYDRKRGMEAALKNLDLPQGANGGDSSHVLAYLEACGGEIETDVLLLNCGLHDIKTHPETGARQVSPQAYADNLRRVVARVAELGFKLVWIRTTPCDEAVHNTPRMTFHRFARDCDLYNRLADEVMAANGVPTIDLHAFTLACGDDIYCDHVHFREPVRQLQAAYLAGWLNGTHAGAT